jgi:hypothetical protein
MCVVQMAAGADAVYAGTDLGPAITVPIIIAAEVALMGFVEVSQPHTCCQSVDQQQLMYATVQDSTVVS